MNSKDSPLYIFQGRDRLYCANPFPPLTHLLQRPDQQLQEPSFQHLKNPYGLLQRFLRNIT